MSYYITRVELHYATYEDYERLHAAMRQAGFSRFVVGDNGQTYHLPTAEYYVEGNYEASTVRDAAVRAATTTGKNFAVIVTRGSSLSWQGLVAA